MSFTRKHIYASTPATTRGQPIHLGGDPKGENFLYTNGNSVFMRNIKEPLICDHYFEHQHPTTVARYAPSGFYIASADITGTVRIWDTVNATHILKKEFKPLSGAIYDLAWSNDSQRIVAVGDGKEKYGAAFLADSGASVGEITAHAKLIKSVDIKQTRPFKVVTASEDFLVNFFNFPPAKFVHSIKDHTRFVNVVRFSPNGERFASGSTDKRVFLYEGKEGQKVAELPEESHSGGIYSLSWAADSSRFLTASADKTVKIWDANTLQNVVTFQFPDTVEDQQLGSLWQGDFMLSVSLSGDINYLDPKSGKVFRVIKGHNKFVTALAYDKSSRRIYSGSYDGVLNTWGYDQGSNQPFTGIGHNNQINAVTIAGSDVVTAGKDDCLVCSDKESYKFGSKVGVEASADDVAAVGNSDTAVAVTRLAIFVVKKGSKLSELKVSFAPTCVAVSPDSSEVAVGGSDSKVHLFQLSGNNLKETSALERHRSALAGVAYSPNGKLLVSADNNRDIVVWDRATKKIVIDEWCHHTAKVNSLAFSPDSEHLASAGLDRMVIVWNFKEPTKRITIKDAHHGGVNSVLFVDDNTVLSAGQDCSLKTWTLTY
jgi:WD40 repeat protein